MTIQQGATAQNEQSVQEVSKQALKVSKQRRLARTHADYWKERLFRNTYTRDGRLCEVNEFSVKIQHLGVRKTIALNTTNTERAARKARDIYLAIVARGWDAALAEYAPDMIEHSDAPTVGTFLEAVKAVSSHIRAESFEIYARKFRTLVAGVFGVKGGESKHDHVNGGYQQWLEKIIRIKLHRITPDRVEKWKARYLSAVADNPLQLKHAQATLLSILRSSKALFSPKKVLPSLKSIRLPDPLPLDGVQLPKKPRSRYKSVFKNGFTPQILVVRAKADLAENQPELFKMVLLAIGAGLRRDEIDTLTWEQIDFVNSRIRVETNAYTRTKSEDSEEDVDVDPDLLAIFKEYKQESQSRFVINSAVEPRTSAHTYHHYRCHRLFRRLNDWLRGLGIESRNPLHTLRKEFGSQICAQAGIFAASAALRHSSIQITRDTYVEQKKPTVFAIGKVLKDATLQPVAVNTQP